MRNRLRLFSVIAAAVLLAGVACSAVASTSLPAPGSADNSGGATNASGATDAGGGANARGAANGSVSSVSPALPSADDLTFGQAAGRVLIGLSIRPGRPGPNTVLVYVVPVEGPTLAAAVPLSLSVAGRDVSLETCSRTCRMATDVSLEGSEHIDVVAGGASGGSASFDLPPLPAQNGDALLQLVQERMHQLRTYRVDEILGPATPPLRANYTFQAPDRMELHLANGATTVWVGPTRYTRATEPDAWQAMAFGTSLPVPSFVWDIPESGGTYLGAHLVGTDTVDGVDTHILAFFLELPQTPVWFSLWADASGLVHRATMHAQGHFMEHRYTDFDAPLSVEPPI